MIYAENLSKTYKNGFKAVDNLSLNIKRGDIYGFLGPNGAGKTTTIRMLTGLLKPSEGIIKINGISVVDNSKEINKFIGVLPESHGYYNWMTAYEYLFYFYKLFKLDLSEAEEYIKDLLDKVGLKNRMHTKVGQYSRGMKQRLGLAKTLINKPQIIILDEPTLGLDPRGQKDIHNLIKELNISMEITVFITSHLLKDIEVLCNKVAIVKNGKLLVEDTIENLQSTYSKGDTFYIKTSDDLKAKEIIEHNNLASNIEVKNGGLTIISEKQEMSDIVKQSIIGKIFAEKLDVLEVYKYKTTIEDIFLELVKDKNPKEVLI